MGADACRRNDAEVLVLLRGFDEASSQIVHSRSSYKSDDIVWDARFTEFFLRSESESRAIVGVDLGRLAEIERIFND